MQKNVMTPRLGIIGVPTNSTGTIEGVAHAPQALRHAGLIDALQQVADVKDYGDVIVLVPTPERSQASGIIAEESLLSMTQGVQQAVERALTDERFPLVIGGDCPVLLGCLAAARSRFARTGLLFVDGHGDAYPPQQSTTGEAADMELGLALGQDTSGLPPELVQMLPLLAPADVSLMGIRDSATLHAEGVRSVAGEITAYGAAVLETGDIKAATQSASDHVRMHVDSWWLHVDLDVLSTRALAAVDYPHPGGLDWAQLEVLTTTAITTTGLIGWDVTIFDILPRLERRGIPSHC